MFGSTRSVQNTGGGTRVETSTMARPIRLLAAAFVVTGAVVLAFQSGAFTMVTADRDVSANVAPDPQAYLAVEDAYGGGTVRNYYCFFFGCFEIDIPRMASQLENRYVEDYDTVDVRIASGPDDVLEVRDAPGQLAVGATASVGLGCTGDVEESGTTDVTLEFDASGSYIDVDDARVTVQDVEYDCRQF